MACTVEIAGKPYALDYLAEGAANIVYKLRPYHPCLLRLRKERSDDVAYSDLVSNFHRIVAPLFPQDALIQPVLFKLPDDGVLVHELNEALRAREADGSRSEKRRGVYLALDEEYGILVQDITPRHESEKFVEFKPKWLIQSPSAPRGAKRCRTCALRDMRRSVNVVGGRGEGNFCPLDLLSTEDDVLKDVIRSLVGDELEFVKDIFKERVRPLLIRLKALQTEYNRVGLADIYKRHSGISSNKDVDQSENVAFSPSSDTLVGMTIRDCSVFIRYDVRNAETEAEVKLADLDMKRAKLEKWANTERQLINGGWYTGDEDRPERSRQRFCRNLQQN